MKKTVSKSVSVFLSLALLITFVPLFSVSSSALPSTSADGLWRYIVNEDGTAVITTDNSDSPAYLGDEKNVTVPSEIDGHTVVSVGKGAFAYKDMSSVVLPDTIESIGDFAFRENKHLTSIVIPDSVIKIGEAAFIYNESLQTVTFGKNVRNISFDAFGWCTSLASVDLPDSLRILSDDAFRGCSSLSSIKAPNNLETVGENVVQDTAFYNNAANWSAQMLYLGNALVDVKPEITGTALVKADATVIACRAFSGCASLTGVTIAGKARLLVQAFYGCSLLETITFLDEITYVGSNVFESTAYYKNENNWIGNVLYIGNVLVKANRDITGKYYIKNGTVTIAAYAFDYCQNQAFEEIVVPETVKYIGDNAFARSTVKSVNIPSQVTEIPQRAFAASNITAIEIPASIKTIGSNAFYLCRSLKEVVIPEGTETLESGAFSDCYTLQSVTIAKSVTSIADDAFIRCSQLKVIYGYSGSAAEKYANDNGISFEPLVESIDFPDVAEGDWYYEAVQYCAGKGFITGYKNGKFGPADALQRQDFVVILARIAGADTSGYTSCKLTDVDMNAYYGKAVAWAVDQEIIGGYRNGKFGVGDKITREQVATILYRYKGSPAVDTSVLNKFADKGKISAFALDALAWANQNGIINGKNATTIAPTLTASRAEIATIVMRMDKQGMFDLS